MRRHVSVGCRCILPKLRKYLLRSVFHQFSRQLSSVSSTSQHWQLLSAVCLERFPVVTQSMTKMEESYQLMLNDMEFERSLMSDHELRHRDDVAMAEKRKQEDYEESEVETTTQTALDVEDAWEAEAKIFIPADKMTEADRESDMKSSERCLDKKLVLIVRQKLGDKTHWILPQGPRLGDESMREAAERVLARHCGDQLRAVFLGNAPCGFYKYNYSLNVEAGSGAKVFFFKADYQGGDVQIDTEQTQDVLDYMWVTKEELSKYVSKSYYKCLDKFIMNLS